MGQITTHVLDTARGCPANGIRIELQKALGNGQWEDITQGTTNDDGRIPGFMSDDKTIAPGIYRMIFYTGDYFTANQLEGFYPEANVIFELKDTSHHHIPLLLSPYGYSTYRGS